jgi:hypothetical protein
MNNNLKFEKTGAAGSTGPVYSYSDLNDSRVKGQIECMETDLRSDLSRMLFLVRNYLDMAFIIAEEQPDYFDAATAQTIAKQLIDTQEQGIEEILAVLEKKTGQIHVVKTVRANGHLEESRVVDVYFDESRISR